MTILFEKEIDGGFDFDEKKQCEEVIEGCMDIMLFPFEAEVSVTLTDDEAIRQINNEYRGIDSATDVLSFPMISYEESGNFDAIDDDESLFNPESGEVMLGDIVLSVPRIKEQALEYGHSELREFSFLIVHSMLHLFGYDHIDDNDRSIMEDKQKYILDILNIKR